MKNNNYNLFLFLITFTRGIVESFSLVLLYKKGFNLDDILLFLTVMYGVGIIVNYISLKFNYKIILIISSLLYGISYLYLTMMDINITSLIIFGLLLSFSTYSYHCLRHYLALSFKLDNTSLIVNIMFLGVIISTIIGTFIVSKLSILWVSIILFILSIISLIPIYKFKIEERNDSKKVMISNRRIVFNVFEQFKVIFLELQPLFLYMYINDSILYVGGFNIVINIASLIVLVLARKLSVNKYYIYISFLLTLLFLFKISLSNMIVLFIIAVGEGILVKLYERGSLSTLYRIGNNSVKKYLWVEEFIFFFSKTVLIFLFLILNLKLKSILFICLIGIVISGFIYKEDM